VDDKKKDQKTVEYCRARSRGGFTEGGGRTCHSQNGTKPSHVQKNGRMGHRAGWKASLIVKKEWYKKSSYKGEDIKG